MGQRASPTIGGGGARRTGGMAGLAGGMGAGEADAGGRAAEVGAGGLPGEEKENPYLPVVKIVSLDDFSQVVAETAKSAVGEFVLIGGLAVGAWAQYFNVPTGGPVFSKDIDLRGTRLVAQAMAQGMKLRGAKIKGLVAARRKEPAGLGMNFVVPLDLADGRSTVIEVLEALPWVDDGPDRPYGFGVEVEGIPLLDPLSLFIGKLHAWHHRNDPEKTSNDRLHLELLGEIIPQFLTEAERRGVDTRERREVLLGFLDLHTTPLSPAALAGLREALQTGETPSSR